MFIAEREGFEPPEPLSSTVFKTAAIDHSAILPGNFQYVRGELSRSISSVCGAKLQIFFVIAKM